MSGMTTRSAAGALLAASILLAGLAGCVDATEPEAGPSASSTSSPSASPSEEPTEEPSPAPSIEPPAQGGLEALPFDATCEQLVSPQALYDYNPNYGTDPAPVPGETITAIGQAGGVTCGWLNQTSSDRIAAGVIRLTPASLASVQATAPDRADRTDAIENGWFRANGSVGHLEFFSGEHWVVVEGAALIDAAEAAAFAETIRSSLP